MIATKPQKLPQVEFIHKPTFNDVPQKELMQKGAMVYVAGALLWDYADTVLDLARLYKLSSTRSTSRRILEIRKLYDKMLREDLANDDMNSIEDLSYQLETLASQDLTKLCNALSAEITFKTPHIDDRIKQIVIAVQMCMAVIDAVKAYGAECDKFVEQYYPDVKHGIIPDHITILSNLIPIYAGEYYNRNSNARALTAKILLRHMKSVTFHDGIELR